MLNDGRFRGRKAHCFTLQWHLTNACERSCRHCYDRSNLSALTLGQARDVLAQLEGFCAAHEVAGEALHVGDQLRDDVVGGAILELDQHPQAGGTLHQRGHRAGPPGADEQVAFPVAGNRPTIFPGRPWAAPRACGRRRWR